MKPIIDTQNRKIISEIPHPDSQRVLTNIYRKEIKGVRGQPEVIWDRASGFQVFDPFGNTFIDFSSGVLVANCGHSHPKVREAIRREVDRGLIHSFCFPNLAKEKLLAKLKEISPPDLEAFYLQSSGSEAVECLLKSARLWARKNHHPGKRVMVTFENSFHGRTMGAQQLGGDEGAKEWIGPRDHSFVTVPFPDGINCPDLSFDCFTNSLAEKGVAPRDVAAVLVETFQGGVVSFAPVAYMKALRGWCDANQALLMFDELQAGFGRTGTWWGFEHYQVAPDLVACGKGLSGGLPISAVLGRSDIMGMYDYLSMTSTHSGNPVCCAAAAASIEVLQEEGLVENANILGKLLLDELLAVKEAAPHRIRAIKGRGLVAGVHIIDPRTGKPDGESAGRVVMNCVSQGLLMFMPVGGGGGTIKICPPLCITGSAVKEGVSILVQAINNEAK